MLIENEKQEYTARLPEEVTIYIQNGWRMFPVKAKSKEPQIPEWQKFATTNKAHLVSWWKQWPGANIGVATGRESNLFVLDIDVKPAEGRDGHRALGELERKYGPLPQTVRAQTSCGGEHVYFQYPADRELRNTAGALGPGLDTRGEGGFVVGPPSIHPNGSAYTFSADHHPLHIPLALPPHWLLNLLLTKKPKPEPHARVNGGIPPGQRNDSLTSKAGAMRRSGCNEHEISEALQGINQRECRPPLDADEVAQIARSVARYEPGGTHREPSLWPLRTHRPYLPPHGPRLNLMPSMGLRGNLPKPSLLIARQTPLEFYCTCSSWLGAGLALARMLRLSTNPIQRA